MIRKLELDGRLHEDKPVTRAFKAYVLALATPYVFKAIRAVGEQAVSGDLEAIRFLLDFVARNAEELAPGSWTAPGRG